MSASSSLTLAQCHHLAVTYFPLILATAEKIKESEARTTAIAVATIEPVAASSSPSISCKASLYKIKQLLNCSILDFSLEEAKKVATLGALKKIRAEDCFDYAARLDGSNFNDFYKMVDTLRNTPGLEVREKVQNVAFQPRSMAEMDAIVKNVAFRVFNDPISYFAFSPR